MGIKDLLRFLKPYVEPIHIKKYAGKRVGIDAYSWLHKGAYSCSMEICLNMDGDKKLQYLKYCMHRINLLRHHKITPVVVFDGGNLPSKARTEKDRHRKRKANLDLAMEKLKDGNTGAAYELFQRAVSITPAMAHQLIQILRSENIEFVVAPYEADAQLAYLSTLEEEKGGIAAVISEDSDLLAYGCPSVVFKMDRLGNGEEIVLDKVFHSVACVPSFRNFDRNLFIGMCVLAGCDFLPSIPGIGMSKAHSLVSKYRNLDRVLYILKFEKGNQVPEDYLKSFKEAMAVFQHARIYDALSKSLKHIKPLPEMILQSLNDELDFLGPDISPSMATAIAEGKLDPCTMEAFSYFPGSESNLNPTTSFQTDRVPRQETSTMSTQESCFAVISSHKTKGQRTTVMKQEAVLEERKQQLSGLEQWKHSNESLALEKLVTPFKSRTPEEITILPDKNGSIIPNNNPFKKRKLDELVLDDQTESCTEQDSVVTDVESSEILCVTPESQSVDSKPVKITDGKRRDRGEEKVKKVDCFGLENKKNSILNFFSRV